MFHLDNGPILPDRGRWEPWGTRQTSPSSFLPSVLSSCKASQPTPPRGLSFIEGVFKSETASYPVRSLKAGWSCSESESLFTTMALEWKRVSVTRVCSKVVFLWHSLLTHSPCQPGAEISSLWRSNYRTSKHPWKIVKTKWQQKYKARGDVV